MNQVGSYGDLSRRLELRIVPEMKNWPNLGSVWAKLLYSKFETKTDRHTQLWWVQCLKVDNFWGYKSKSVSRTQLTTFIATFIVYFSRMTQWCSSTQLAMMETAWNLFHPSCVTRQVFLLVSHEKQAFRSAMYKTMPPLTFQEGAFALEVGANVEASSAPATVVLSKDCADVGLQCSTEVWKMFLLQYSYIETH